MLTAYVGAVFFLKTALGLSLHLLWPFIIIHTSEVCTFGFGSSIKVFKVATYAEQTVGALELPELKLDAIE